MIRKNLNHKHRTSLNNYADILGSDLRTYFGKRVLGPEFPIISQIQLWYIKTILIKIEKEKPLVRAKEMIQEAITRLEEVKGAGAVRIAIDVDPY